MWKLFSVGPWAKPLFESAETKIANEATEVLVVRVSSKAISQECEHVVLPHRDALHREDQVAWCDMVGIVRWNKGRIDDRAFELPR